MRDFYHHTFEVLLQTIYKFMSNLTCKFKVQRLRIFKGYFKTRNYFLLKCCQR